MHQFLATFCKDLMLLWRDRAGMLVLFVMPMVLVLVVSLVQNNVLEATGQAALKVLFVSPEQDFIGQQIRQRLLKSEGIKVIEKIGSEPLTENDIRQLLIDGDYQFGIVIPEGTSKQLKYKVQQKVAAIFTSTTANDNGAIKAEIQIFFNPTVRGVSRTAVLSSIRYALLGLETAVKGRELSRVLRDQIDVSDSAILGSGAQLLGRHQILSIDQQFVGLPEKREQPNAVQQNVPAWSLFGMFFIVVPLSGALLRERQEGTLRRLMTLPVPYLVLLAGKTLAYVVVCMLQFCLMLFVGKFILPQFGTPVFELTDQIMAVFLLAFCSALAATGYGLLIGTIARSYDQASMFGAVSVVIAAALGGVMVPVYVMPKGMQLISNFSPLAWGLDGFLDLFVRNGNLQSIAQNMLTLFGFFLVTTTISLLVFSRRCCSGG